MSKQGKRKITVDLPKQTKDLTIRPSVFERLGTKKTSAKKTTEHCRQWAQHGSCAYGKGCKFASTHTLISPSKQRAANKDSEVVVKRLLKDDPKNRLHSTVVVRTGRSPEGEIDNWDQNDLEYADTDVLEKRRQQLQRELELQLKMDSSKGKDKKKAVSSSSSSRSSSSSSVSSSTSNGSSSSSSSERDPRKKGKKGKLKRNSSSSSDDGPSKKKYIKNDSLKRDKIEPKKSNVKKDDRLPKKHTVVKKKITKGTLGKKSLSPGKKAGGTPPISLKNPSKSYSVSKHGKSPPRRDKNRSVSPPSVKDRDKDRPKDKDKERDKDRDKDRDRNRGRSRSLRKGRSRSPRRNESHPKDPRHKDSSERSRPISPKKQVRRDVSSDRHRKRSGSKDRDRNRDHKDRSLERRKDKHDDKDRHDRKDRLDRGRERPKDTKRDDNKRNKGRDRGLGRGGGSDKGLEKPNKPMERLLPRPEERLAALAAISNRTLEVDKASTNSKDRQDSHSERGGRKQDRNERDRSGKRGERMDSIDREQVDYDLGMERQYEHGHQIEHYDRVDDRYDDGPREDDRSPGYSMQSRDRRYDPGYDMPGPPRNYPEDEDRMYNDRMADHRGDMGYDERRQHGDRSWEGRAGSIDGERGYIHPHKEWEGDDYRGGEWGRDRHWPMHDPQMGEWGDKEPEMEGWHHRGHPQGPHRTRPHGDYNRGMRIDLNRPDNNKRRQQQRPEVDPPKETAPPAPVSVPQPASTRPDTEVDDNPIPDDLSEISDDPDDILNREDMVDQTIDEDSQAAHTPTDENVLKTETSENQSTQGTSAAGEEKESLEHKDDDEVTNLDFEEISDGELEEERTRAGLGDALGVDWASLVAEVRRREQAAPCGGARERWRPAAALRRLGVSLEMAGRDTFSAILQQDAPNVDNVHPVASIQVAIEKRQGTRAALFGSGCEIRRALSARRDLALRRHLCRLPPTERSGQARAPQPALFHAARALLMRG